VNKLRKRIEKVVKNFKKKNYDGILVFNPTNIGYLTGYKSFPGAALISEKDRMLFADQLYYEEVKVNTENYQIELKDKNFYAALEKTINQFGMEKIGFEDNYVTVDNYNNLKKKLKHINFKPLKGLLEAIRTIKEKDEIENIKKAALLGDEAFNNLLTFIKPEMSEIDIALELEHFIRKNGADDVSFKIIVASGKRSALPHGEPTNKKLQKGDLVVIDFGTVVNGYHSDMTRTIGIGKLSPEQKKIYSVVKKAQEHTIQFLKVGLTGTAVDGLARNFIESAGYGNYFTHSTGHGLGLAVHEEPKLSSSGNMLLRSQMVITVEPGIYIPGLCGVRIEDMVLLKENSIETLTKSGRELILI